MYQRLIIYVGYYLLTLAGLQDRLAFLMTLPMLCLVLFNISRIRDRFFTLSDLVHFLFYLSFVIEPIQMLDHGRIGRTGAVSETLYPDSEIISAMLVAILFYGGYALSQFTRTSNPIKTKFFTLPSRYAPLLFACAVGCFAVSVFGSGGLAAVISSRYDKLSNASAASDFGALLTVVNAGLTASIIIMATFLRSNNVFAKVLLLVAIGLDLVIYNPFNAARFGLIATYAPIALIVVNGRVRATLFYGTAVFAILIVFPVLSISTRFGINGFTEHTDSLFSDIFSLVFIDVFDLLVECVHYTAIHGHTWGNKLLADLVVLFPRAWWPSKPTLAGNDIGAGVFNDHLYGTANLSQIVAGDAYMDFGFIGALVVGVILGWLIKKLAVRRRRFINEQDLVGYVLVANLPILFRGPLGAVVITFVAQAVFIIGARTLLALRTPSPRNAKPAGLGVLSRVRGGRGGEAEHDRGLASALAVTRAPVSAIL